MISLRSGGKLHGLWCRVPRLYRRQIKGLGFRGLGFRGLIH